MRLNVQTLLILNSFQDPDPPDESDCRISGYPVEALKRIQDEDLTFYSAALRCSG
jgi:hypothetical protein